MDRQNDGSEHIDNPIQEVFSISKEQLEEIREKARQEAINTKHVYKQRGAWLVCTSCEFEHGMFIGVKRLKGFRDTGEPILEDLGRKAR